jgi:hypothetical protein
LSVSWCQRRLFWKCLRQVTIYQQVFDRSCLTSGGSTTNTRNTSLKRRSPMELLRRFTDAVLWLICVLVHIFHTPAR